MKTHMRKKIRKAFKFKEITEQSTNNLQVSLNCIEELAKKCFTSSAVKNACCLVRIFFFNGWLPNPLSQNSIFLRCKDRLGLCGTALA